MNELISKIKKILPELEVTDYLKRGGQKVVYSGRHSVHGQVVIKIIQASNEDETKRGLREIETTQNLNSNYFAKLYQCGKLDANTNSIYVIEELIQGKDLKEIIQEQPSNKIAITEVRRILDAILLSLSVIEPLQLVHRDIKPANIIVNPERVVLIDFGIARQLDKESLTDTHAIFGPMTPGYAPPEQIRNEKRKISTRTDLFSLGVVAYELLTGVNPFIKDNARKSLHRVVNYIPKKLEEYGYHESFDNFVFSCIEKSPHRRPANVSMAKNIFNLIKWEA